MAIILAEGQTTVTLEKDKDARRDYRFSLVNILPPGDPLKSLAFSPVAGVVIDGVDYTNTDVVLWVAGGTPESWYVTTATYETIGGYKDQFTLRVFINKDAELESDLGSALFPNKFTAVAQLRRDRLVLAAANYFPGVTLDSEYIWSKLRAAESAISRTLRVKFCPTAFFPTEPTQEQITALNGMPWAIDAAYDYDPEMFQGECWGFIPARNKPLISVQMLRFAYPAPNVVNFDIPPEWLRLDKKYGQVRIVPTTITSVGVLGPALMQLIGGGRVIPHILEMTYVAGLANAAQDYPELVDAVKKMAVLKIIEDAFVPQSGSISADGLSQSMSADMSKYEDSIDRILNGPPDANGGLMAAIHGIRLGVM